MRLFHILPIIFFLVLILNGCSEQKEKDKIPEVLRIGILPDQSVETLLERYTPLLVHISSKTGVPYKLIIPESYEDLLELFDKGSIDLAYFGGLTYSQAHFTSGAIPLVMRDIDVHFTSYFISNNKSNSKNIEDFKDKSFSFGSRLSTSGHLMPRYFLQDKNIIAEKFFKKIQYSGSHDKTAFWVRDGIVDVGAVNSKIIDKLFKEKKLSQNNINIIWETPPYPDYVWAVQSNIGPKSRNRIRDAFLSLSYSKESHAEILQGLDSKGFLPASQDDFSLLKDIAFQIGLLKENSGVH